MKKAIAIMNKDLKEIIRNSQIFGPVIILPILFGVFLPMMFFIMPLEAGFLLMNILNGFFLLMGVLIPIVIASDSFAGEKERKTIEALLAAPISDSELFLGKVLVSLIPAILSTYFAATLYCILINLRFQIFIMPNLAFLIIMIFVPLFALLGIELTVFISVRVKGFREASQLSIVSFLPALVVIVLPILGIPLFDFPWNILLFIVVIFADVGLYGLAIKKFGRENIITKI